MYNTTSKAWQQHTSFSGDRPKMRSFTGCTVASCGCSRIAVQLLCIAHKGMLLGYKMSHNHESSKMFHKTYLKMALNTWHKEKQNSRTSTKASLILVYPTRGVKAKGNTYPQDTPAADRRKAAWHRTSALSTGTACWYCYSLWHTLLMWHQAGWPSSYQQQCLTLRHRSRTLCSPLHPSSWILRDKVKCSVSSTGI